MSIGLSQHLRLEGERRRRSRNRRTFAVALTAATVLAMPPVAFAQSTKEKIFAFLKEVGCTQLPFAACEALDANDAKSVGYTIGIFPTCSAHEKADLPNEWSPFKYPVLTKAAAMGDR